MENQDLRIRVSIGALRREVACLIEVCDLEILSRQVDRSGQRAHFLFLVAILESSLGLFLCRAVQATRSINICGLP